MSFIDRLFVVLTVGVYTGWLYHSLSSEFNERHKELLKKLEEMEK